MSFRNQSLRTLVLVAAILVGLFFSESASAIGLMLEPYAGYELDNSSLGVSPNVLTAPSGGTIAINSSGAAAGGRLSLSGQHLFLAVDYSYGWLNGTVASQPDGFSTSVGGITRSTLGADLGFHYRRLRIFAGYDFLNDWDFKGSATGGSDLMLHGTAIHGGLSILLFYHLELNAEYRMSTFNKYNDGADHDFGDSNTYDKATSSSFIFSLGVPFRL